RLLEALDRLARLLQRDPRGEQVLRSLDRDEIAERVVESAAFADGRADEADLLPVAQPRFLHGEDAGNVAKRIQLDHGDLRSSGLESTDDLGGSWRASTVSDRCSCAPRARLSMSTCGASSSQPAARRASASAIRRA